MTDYYGLSFSYRCKDCGDFARSVINELSFNIGRDYNTAINPKALLKDKMIACLPEGWGIIKWGETVNENSSGLISENYAVLCPSCLLKYVEYNIMQREREKYIADNMIIVGSRGLHTENG